MKNTPTKDISVETKRKEKLKNKKKNENEEEEEEELNELLVPSHFRPYISTSLKELSNLSKEQEIWRSKTLKSNSVPQYPVLSVKLNKFSG